MTYAVGGVDCRRIAASISHPDTRRLHSRHAQSGASTIAVSLQAEPSAHADLAELIASASRSGASTIAVSLQAEPSAHADLAELIASASRVRQ
ncbi:hypothetical protein CVT25_001014 [Psilocybe cyanescens]|uniref:Uncharacterized protein n=1 Tax=Psilocybe cyanescens TaxID=93625 RepID=A0A409XSB9_PSICY|nr:hypothetical protein CVT25_001014 [Psilocybe cyanescens]